MIIPSILFVIFFFLNFILTIQWQDELKLFTNSIIGQKASTKQMLHSLNGTGEGW